VGHVPETHGTGIACGGHHPTVAAERYGVEGILVAQQRPAEGLVATHIP
jgi:hypothetical protein